MHSVADIDYSYGFIRYHNFVAAENCIRGFFHRGYEAKFAKVRSVFERLAWKTLKLS